MKLFDLRYTSGQFGPIRYLIRAKNEREARQLASEDLGEKAWLNPKETPSYIVTVGGPSGILFEEHYPE
jgi:hypothetical protein